MYLNDYVGKFIKEDEYYGYQSTDLISNYVQILTLGQYKTKLNANKMEYERLPSSWKIIKTKYLLETDDYKEGDIFVSKNASVFGFNGIIVRNYNFNNVTVITQNKDGKGTKPVEEHLYSKEDIDYIIRPDDIDYKEHFKQSGSKEKVIISKKEYEKLLEAYNNMKEVFK